MNILDLSNGKPLYLSNGKPLYFLLWALWKKRKRKKTWNKRKLFSSDHKSCADFYIFIDSISSLSLKSFLRTFFLGAHDNVTLMISTASIITVRRTTIYRLLFFNNLKYFFQTSNSHFQTRLYRHTSIYKCFKTSDKTLMLQIHTISTKIYKAIILHVYQCVLWHINTSINSTCLLTFA